MVVPQVLRTAFYFVQSAMTGHIVSVFPFRNRVSPAEAFEGLELGEGKLSRPVLRGPGGRKTASSCVTHRETNRLCAIYAPTCARTGLNPGWMKRHFYQDKTGKKKFRWLCVRRGYCLSLS